MATRKAKGAPKDEIHPCKSVPIGKGATEKETNSNFARLATSPELAAFCVLGSANSKGTLSGIWEGLDVPSLIDELRDQAAAVNRGDLKQVEAMLMNQAVALQSLFARLTERGMSCDHAPAFEANMRIALRAQSQCRAALETLAAIKNPPVVFAKQANIANGHQQINNGTPAATHAGKTINQQNELLEAQHGGETVDTRTKSRAGGKNKAMAAVV